MNVLSSYWDLNPCSLDLKPSSLLALKSTVLKVDARLHALRGCDGLVSHPDVGRPERLKPAD